MMKKYTTEIKWALIFTAIGLLWMLFEKQLGWHDEKIGKHAVYTNIFALVAFIVYYFALRDKRERDFGGKMSWAQGLISGAILSVFAAILTPIATYLTHNVISPEYFGNAIEHAVEVKGIAREVAERNFSIKNYYIMSPVIAIFYGIVTAALMSLLVRRK